MPVKPRSRRIRCSKCGWETVYAPLSDALLTPLPQVCEQCGSTELSRYPVTEPADDRRGPFSWLFRRR